MARDFETRERDPYEVRAEKPLNTMAERVATLEQQIDRISGLVAELGEHAARVSKELGL